MKDRVAVRRGRPRETLPFEQACALVRRLQLSSPLAYAVARLTDPRLKAQLPASPQVSYLRSGWRTWADFLGTGGSEERAVLGYRQACQRVRQLQLRTRRDYELWISSAEADPALPRLPSRQYRAQWKSWSAFLGVDAPASRGSRQVYYTLPAARACVRRLNIRTAAQYRRLLLTAQLPAGLPPSPEQYYGAQFGSWAKFLGSRRPGRAAAVPMHGSWLTYEAARTLVRHLRILTPAQWTRFAASPSRPPYLPKAPWIAYAGAGFRSMDEFLGHVPAR